MTESTMAYASSNTSYSADSTTTYGPFNADGGQAVSDTSETASQAIWRGGSVTVKNFRVRAGANSRTTNTLVRMRVNGANGNGLVTVTGSSGPGIFTDLVNTDALTDGDTWDYSVTTGTGAGGTNVSLSCQIEKASGQISAPLALYGSAAQTGLRYHVPGAGSFASGTSEANAAGTALETATLTNLQVYVRTNTSAAGMEIRVRKNTADGNLVIAAATMGTATGWFEDVTNSVSLSAGDTWCFKNTAPSASITLGYVGVTYAGATAGRTSMYSPTFALSAGTTAYNPLGRSGWGATEGNCQWAMPFSGTLSLFSARVPTNATSTSTTLIVRKNTADGSGTLVYTAAETGLKQDVTNSDSFSAGETIGVKAVAGATGSFGLAWMGALLQGPVTGAGGSGMMLMGAG